MVGGCYGKVLCIGEARVSLDLLDSTDTKCGGGWIEGESKPQQLITKIPLAFAPAHTHPIPLPNPLMMSCRHYLCLGPSAGARGCLFSYAS